MRVTQLWRFPVKSLGGEQVESSSVTELGLDGDRRWGLVDNETGKVLSAKRDGRLLLASSRIEAGRPVVRLPDGTETVDSAPIADWLDQDVTLTEAGEDFGRIDNPRDFENESDWEVFESAAHAWHDSKRARVSLVSSTTLGDWDRRRFRSNIVLDGEGEDDLVGHVVRLGTCQLTVGKKIRRCVMVTRAQPGIERDLDVLRTIIRDRNKVLSIGALVEASGTVSVGDVLEGTEG